MIFSSIFRRRAAEGKRKKRYQEMTKHGITSCMKALLDSVAPAPVFLVLRKRRIMILHEDLKVVADSVQKRDQKGLCIEWSACGVQVRTIPGILLL